MYMLRIAIVVCKRKKFEKHCNIGWMSLAGNLIRKGEMKCMQNVILLRPRHRSMSDFAEI